MTEQRLKIVFGFCLLAVLATLCIVIGLGKVEEKTSYGLAGIIGALTVMAGAWCQWAFQIVKGEADRP